MNYITTQATKLHKEKNITELQKVVFVAKQLQERNRIQSSIHPITSFCSNCNNALEKVKTRRVVKNKYS